MSRFSPTVQPSFLDLGSALRGYTEGRQQKRANDRQGQLDQEHQAQIADQKKHDRLSLALQGISEGAKPVDSSSVVSGLSLPSADPSTPQINSSLAGALRSGLPSIGNRNAAPTPTSKTPSLIDLAGGLRSGLDEGSNVRPGPSTPSGANPDGTPRYAQLTPDYYQDTTKTPAYQQAQSLEEKKAALRAAGVPEHLLGIVAAMPSLIEHLQTGPFTKPTPKKLSAPIIGPNGEVQIIDENDPMHPITVPGIRGHLPKEASRTPKDPNIARRESYITSRVKTLMAATKNSIGLTQKGLDYDAALSKATDEADKRWGGDDDQDAPDSPPVPTRPGSGPIDLRDPVQQAQPDYAQAAQKYQEALRRKIDPATARQAYDTDVLAITKKHGLAH